MPARWSARVWAAMKAVAEAARHIAAQYGQRPRPKEGGLFKEPWFARRFQEDPRLLRVDEISIFVDATFKETTDGSYVVIQVWGRCGKASFYLLDQVRDRMEFYVFLRVLLDVRKRWAEMPLGVRRIVLEDKANGPATVSILKRDIPGIQEWPPGTKSKYERAEIGSVPPMQAGQVFFPLDEYAPWLDGYVKRHVAFDGTGSTPDDEIDTTSMALLYWTGGGMSPLELLKKRLPAGLVP
jgi:predicted phage terminase large subunit-like protein